MSQAYQFITEAFVALVVVEDGKITDAAPVLKRFKGQPYDNLVRWCRKKFDSFTIHGFGPDPDVKWLDEPWTEEELERLKIHGIAEHPFSFDENVKPDYNEATDTCVARTSVASEKSKPVKPDWLERPWTEEEKEALRKAEEGPTVPWD